MTVWVVHYLDIDDSHYTTYYGSTVQKVFYNKDSAEKFIDSFRKDRKWYHGKLSEKTLE